MEKKTDLLDRRTIYADALNNSLNKFISYSEKSIADVITGGLQPIAEAANLDRIIVYRVFNIDDNSAGEMYRWDRVEGAVFQEELDLKILSVTPVMKRCVSNMSDDAYINLKRGEFTEEEFAFFDSRDVKSILIAPVFTENELWGIMTFQDHTSEHDFDEDCSRMLRSTARLCVSTIIRDGKIKSADNIVRALKRHDEYKNILNKMSLFFLSQNDKPLDEMIAEGIKPVLDINKINRFSFFRRAADISGHISHAYCWERVSGGVVQHGISFTKAVYTQLAQSWESNYTDGSFINGPVCFLPEREAAIMESAGAVSIFMFPVFINNILWGFALFEDHHNIRRFDEDYAELMQSAAFLCANTIIQFELKKEIKEIEILRQNREADDRMQIMLDATPLGCSLIDRNYNVIDCNMEALKFFKVKNKQIYINIFWDFSPEYQPDGQRSREKAFGYFKQAFEEGYAFFDWTHLVDGEEIPCEIILVRVKYKDDYTIAGYTRDVRELRAATAKLREADERTQIIFDTAPIGSFMFDINMNVIDCNQETVKMFGLRDKNPILDYFIDFSPEYQPCGKKSFDLMKEQHSKALMEGYNRFEWVHQTASGEFMPCEIILVRVKYQKGYAIAGYARDLREHKKLLNEINNENERYKAMAHWYESILNAIPFFVAAQDLNGKCTYINETAESFLGKDWDEIVGTPCREWAFSICDTENCAIECAKRGRMRTHFTHKNESFQVDTKLLKDLNSNTTGYIEVIQDITKMEHLAKQQAEAEAANVAKSSFLSAMSHEMRTPMNAIIGMVSVGKAADSIERKNYALDKIDDASKHLLGVINDVLDMSKIEANKMELSNVSFELRQSLQRAVSLVKFSIEFKHLEFSMNIANNAPSFLYGDDQRLTQVITNLLSNAVKFTPEKGIISLDVELVNEENGICELRFEVADSGIGIASDQHEKIFHPFEQAESGITRTFGGTGLGLVITKNIIELMNGKIWVESEVGNGARFIFTVKLPYVEKEMKTQTVTDNGKEKNIKDIYNKLHEKVLLIVEDIEINREILITLLEDTGLIIETAENGKESVDMVTAVPDKYDLIFMDMQMPVMDGLEATRQIRALEIQLNTKDGNRSDNGKPRKRIPIIAMTANVFQDDIDKCLEAGMDDHIGKPIDINNIIDKLNEYL